MKNPLVKNHKITVIIIIFFSTIIPSMKIMGLLSKDLMPSYLVTTLIASLGGILAGAFITKSQLFTFKGMLLGFLYNVSVFWSSIFYVQIRTITYIIEFAIPIILGALPALFVYFIFFYKKTNKLT